MLGYGAEWEVPHGVHMVRPFWSDSRLPHSKPQKCTPQKCPKNMISGPVSSWGVFLHSAHTAKQQLLSHDHPGIHPPFA